MLSSALLRAVQAPAVRQTSAIFGIASSTVWIRSMARHNRPNHPQNQHKKPTEYSKPPDSPTPKPAGEGPTYTSPQGSQGSNKFQAPAFFKKQPEFSQDASPARNTTPNSEGRGAGVLNSAARTYEHTDFSRKQSEFEAAPSSANTAPQSTSPSGIDPAQIHKEQSSPAAEQSEELPQQPLPDLTQGIPSTIEFELRENAKRDSLNLTEAEEPAQTSSSGGRGKGELPASAYISSSERKRLRFANYMYASFAAFAVIGTIYWGRNWETEEEEKAHPEAPSGWAIGLMWNRAKARLGDQLNYYSEPAFPKLLPNPDPIFERPYTLVLSLEDLLIHSEWSREHGWRMAKRPGVDYFLRYLSQYYELVIFTTQPWAVADPVIRKLDPYHIVTWPLYREATLYEKGEYIKDLSYLNRDLSKVILIDTVPAHAKKQPENAIILKKWEGQVGDKELVSLIPFLEYIHTMAYPDVRKALKSFEGTHIPTEFARREAVARKRFQEQIEEEKKKRPKASGLGFLGNALGIKSGGMMVMADGEQSPAEAFAQGKMLQDQARERGQRNYEALEKEIRENGEKWLKEEAAQEEKMKEEGMKAMKTGFTQWIPGIGTGASSEKK